MKDEKRYCELVETSPDLIWSMNAQGQYTFVSQAAKRIYGYAPAEMIGRAFADFELSQDGENQQFMKRVSGGESHFLYETLHLHQDGTPVHLSFSTAVCKNEQGCVLGMIGTARDITLAKQARTPRQCNTYLRLALKASRIGVWDWDVTTGEIKWLEGVESLLGLPPNSFSGNFADYFHLQDWAVTYQVITHAIETETNHCVEYRILRPDGTIRWIEGKAEFLRDANGCIVRMIGTAIDITERKQMEEGLRQSEARLRTQAEMAQAQTQQLKQTLQKLQQTQAQLVQSEKMSSLGQLVAGMAHEINNPVNFIHVNLAHARQYTQDLFHLLYLYQRYYPHLPPEIQAQVDAIDLDFVSEDLPKLLSSMNCGTNRIREIVLSLRSFSRLDEAEMKTVDIHSGIDSTLLILQHRLKATCQHPGIQVNKQYGDLPLVECYAGQLNQVFLNLITNAIDALEEQRIGNEAVGTRDWVFPVPRPPSPVPEVRIRTEVLDTDRILISIADNGPGVSEAVQPRLFDPFFTTKPVGKGRGLGLAISYQIVVEKHGGHLCLSSASRQGTEFLIELPLRQQLYAQPA